MKCPYCKGNLKMQEDVRHIGAFAIVCDDCGAVWVDEDDIVAATIRDETV